MKLDFFKTIKSVRKTMPPPSKVILPKKRYDRKDRSWMKNGDY